MITENMNIHSLHILSLAIPPVRWLEAAGCYFNTASTVRVCLTVLAVVAIIITAILLSIIIVRHIHYEQRLKRKIAEIKRGQVGILEDITDDEPPPEQIPRFDPQEMKDLSELANRLR